MRNKAILTLALCIFSAAGLFAQKNNPTEGMKFYDAQEFKMINNGFPVEVKDDPYMRIPSVMKDSLEAGLWNCLRHSSGLAIRFATDSKAIGVQYRLRGTFHMNHMADTGIKGMDLYRLSDKGKWQYVNTVRPASNDPLQNYKFVERMDGGMHEYMIYLPIYEGVEWMKIGVDPESEITVPKVDNPVAARGKIVWYGTSILHGGCASRPGMTSSNIIQRELGIECVNIATSGQGKMYYPMARVLAKMEDVACYVIDPVPNCTLGMCDTVTCNFVNIIRKARPDVPIIMLEGPMYPYAKFDSFFAEYLPQKNAAFRKCYEQMKKENPKNLYYVDCEGLNGPEDEGTVDGIHLTDYGFRAYADKMEPILRKVLKLKKR